MAEKPSEKPVYFTLRQLAFALGWNYNRLRYYCWTQPYTGIIEHDGETSDGNPLFLVTNLPKIKARLRLHGLHKDVN